MTAIPVDILPRGRELPQRLRHEGRKEDAEREESKNERKGDGTGHREPGVREQVVKCLPECPGFGDHRLPSTALFERASYLSSEINSLLGLPRREPADPSFAPYLAAIAPTVEPHCDTFDRSVARLRRKCRLRQAIRMPLHQRLTLRGPLQPGYRPRPRGIETHVRPRYLRRASGSRIR